MAMGDYFTIIPKKVWQLTGNKERETGGGYDCLHFKET